MPTGTLWTTKEDWPEAKSNASIFFEKASTQCGWKAGGSFRLMSAARRSLMRLFATGTSTTVRKLRIGQRPTPVTSGFASCCQVVWLFYRRSLAASQTPAPSLVISITITYPGFVREVDFERRLLRHRYRNLIPGDGETRLGLAETLTLCQHRPTATTNDTH